MGGSNLYRNNSIVGNSNGLLGTVNNGSQYTKPTYGMNRGKNIQSGMLDSNFGSGNTYNTNSYTGTSDLDTFSKGSFNTYDKKDIFSTINTDNSNKFFGGAKTRGEKSPLKLYNFEGNNQYSTKSTGLLADRHTRIFLLITNPLLMQAANKEEVANMEATKHQ
jgi:hypothetical protein